MENAICSARAQVIVIAFATMSTVSFCTALMRSGCRQQAELHLVGIADQVAGYLAGDVDVEALQFAGHRIAKAEQIGALVHTDDQPAAALDRLHGGADSRWTGADWLWHRSFRRPRRTRDGTTAAPLGSGSVVREADTSASGCTVEQPASRIDCKRENRCDRAHQWYSLSRGAIPAATASAASTPMAAAPAGSTFSAV